MPHSDIVLFSFLLLFIFFGLSFLYHSSWLIQVPHAGKPYTLSCFFLNENSPLHFRTEKDLLRLPLTGCDITWPTAVCWWILIWSRQNFIYIYTQGKWVSPEGVDVSASTPWTHTRTQKDDRYVGNIWDLLCVYIHMKCTSICTSLRVSTLNVPRLPLVWRIRKWTGSCRFGR